METLSALMPSLVGVAVLAAVATTVFVLYRVPRPWAPVSAIARGAVQLAVISVILTGVIGQPLLIATALVVMFLVASTVGLPQARCLRTLVAACGGVHAGRGAVRARHRVRDRCTGAHRALRPGHRGDRDRQLHELHHARGQELPRLGRGPLGRGEGWLALGATPRRATLDLARRAVHDALVPALDQTRTTGLVVLPGAFVGAIFGGVSPLEAGRFQIVVLGAILAAGAVSAALVTLWSGSVPTRPRRPV